MNIIVLNNEWTIYRQATKKKENSILQNIEEISYMSEKKEKTDQN